MAIPVIHSISPEAGPTSGGDIVRITGQGFGDHVAVHFGDTAAEVLSVRSEAGVCLADVRTPGHAVGHVDVVVQTLDGAGAVVPGEEALLPNAYRYQRAQLVQQSDLTRLVRAVLRELKKQLIEATSMTVSVDYDDTTIDGMNVIALSQLPSVVLSGPKLSENRFFSTSVPHEDVVPGPGGPEILRRRPPFTVDLAFSLTAASDRTVELLNLMAAVATFLNRNRWLELPRDPDNGGAGSVRWEMDPEGEFQTQLDGPDDVRAFSCGFVVRGFDIDEGLPLDLGKAVSEGGAELSTQPISSGETS